ncbi:sensor histidine kinase [Streptomyces violens]|uniref:sensor histidine kinase n=1 Tax=Streptomyces violens TaxID=66377 RepID=UPI00068F4C8B|nr:histidine kinase [Streptomyces violens]
MDGRVSPFHAPGRPHRDDVLIAVSGLLGGVLLWFLGLHGGPPLFGLPARLALLALAAMAGAELLRRTAPGTALAVAVAALTLDVLTGTVIATVLMFTDVVYAAVMYGSPAAARRIPRACVLATVLATLLPVALLRDPQALLIGVAVGVGTIGPAWTAVIIRNHREAARAARLRAEQTALLAELDRREAVLAERARMARELHDMVANHLSAIALHATAAQALDEPAATREALGVIRENSVQGLAEMRRLIGLLRNAGGQETSAATPRLDALDALLERARGHGTGSGLTFALTDDRPPGGPPLAAPVELAAYRIVQESVTNALKHAAPGEVTVRLSRSDGALSLAVTSPYGRHPGPRAPGSGSGLVGMGERAALLGGTFEAAPDGAVWRVRATLPADEKEQTP